MMTFFIRFFGGCSPMFSFGACKARKKPNMSFQFTFTNSSSTTHKMKRMWRLYMTFMISNKFHWIYHGLVYCCCCCCICNKQIASVKLITYDMLLESCNLTYWGGQIGCSICKHAMRFKKWTSSTLVC
jgi:hypothetical protein